MRRFSITIAVPVAVLVGVSIASAWTGPTATPPNNNASAPLNVSTVAQTKNGNIGVDGLAVFGNTLLGGSAGSNAYLNFGATAGTNGYGIWDNNGTLSFKNTGGSWQPLQTIINNDITNSNPTFNTVTATQYCIGSSSCITSWPGGVSGSGTAGDIPVFTGASSIGNSIISQSGTTATVAGTLSATTYGNLSSTNNFVSITAIVGDGVSTGANGGTDTVSCPTGYTLLTWGITRDWRSAGGTSGWGYGTLQCIQSGNGIELELNNYSGGSPQTSVRCRALCAAD